MELMNEEDYEVVERAVDMSFQGKFLLKFYDYLKYRKARKIDADAFIDSGTASNIALTVDQLEKYTSKRSDSYMREAYGFIPKAKARKIKEYLNSILEDARRYSYDRRRGRRKKQTK